MPTSRGPTPKYHGWLAALLAFVVFVLPLRVPALELHSIEQAAADYRNPNAHLQEMFRAALLDTSKLASMPPDGTAYIKTGDIPAEWLRDASAQSRPYLFFAKNDPDVRKLLRRASSRAWCKLRADRSVRQRLYAGLPRVGAKVRARLAGISDGTGVELLEDDRRHVVFTPEFSTDAGFDVLATMQREQDHPRNSSYTHKELPNDGKGRPVGYTGMIWTGFRPSDDACYYNFLIPSEMFAVVALGDMAEIERDVYHNVVKAREAKSLRDEVQRGIQTYGLVLVPKYGYIYAYEVDGQGHAILTDDANIPCLLSAPYIGYTTPSDRYYENTRRFLLSQDNPSFYQGQSRARDRQLPHAGSLGVAARADRPRHDRYRRTTEKQDVLTQLLASDPGDHLLHESFNPDDPKQFTRQDFGWPNALFSEFVMTQLQGVAPIPMGDTRDLEFRSE